MASLIHELGRELTGMPSPPSTTLSPQRNALKLTELAGSGRAAARLLGVAESTFRGWRKGVSPRGTANTAMVSAGRRLAALNVGRIGHAYRDGSLAIRGTVTVSNDTRIRTLHPGRQIPSAVMHRILDQWRAGQADGAVESALYAAIDQYYQPVALSNIERVWFE